VVKNAKAIHLTRLTLGVSIRPIPSNTIANNGPRQFFSEIEGQNGWGEMRKTMQDVQKVHPARPQPMKAPEA
jgi:hypothetical protein